jgi:hypothetical protein
VAVSTFVTVAVLVSTGAFVEEAVTVFVAVPRFPIRNVPVSVNDSVRVMRSVGVIDAVRESRTELESVLKRVALREGVCVGGGVRDAVRRSDLVADRVGAEGVVEKLREAVRVIIVVRVGDRESEREIRALRVCRVDD